MLALSKTMNYLAHLHIADHCQSSLLGNLLGDFVKGDPDAQYVRPVAKGIRLHRFVDAYTDSHGVVRDAKLCFSSDTRRFSPIALDMFWDHCLARKWSDYHGLSLAAFVTQSQCRVNAEQTMRVPDRFKRVSGAMWQGGWLESYSDFSNIEFALQRMSQRSERMGKLADCFISLNQHYAQLQDLFDVLYPDVLEQAKLFCRTSQIL